MTQLSAEHQQLQTNIVNQVNAIDLDIKTVLGTIDNHVNTNATTIIGQVNARKNELDAQAASNVAAVLGEIRARTNDIATNTYQNAQGVAAAVDQSMHYLSNQASQIANFALSDLNSAKRDILHNTDVGTNDILDAIDDIGDQIATATIGSGNVNANEVSEIVNAVETSAQVDQAEIQRDVDNQASAIRGSLTSDTAAIQDAVDNGTAELATTLNNDISDLQDTVAQNASDIAVTVGRDIQGVLHDLGGTQDNVIQAIDETQQQTEEAVINAITEPIDSLDTDIHLLSTQVGLITGNVEGALLSNIDEAEGQIAAAAANIIDQIGQNVQSIIPDLPQIIAQISQNIQDFLATLTGNLISGEEFWSTLIQRMFRETILISDDYAPAVPQFIGDQIRGWLERFESANPDQLNDLISTALDYNALSEPWRQMMDNLRPGRHFVNAIPLVGILLGLGISVIHTSVKGMFTNLEKQSNKDWRPSIPTIGEMVAMETKLLLPTDVLDDIGAELGFPDGLIAYYRQMAQTFLTPDALLAHEKRYEQDPEYADAILRRLGYRQPDIQRIRDLSVVAPTPDDLIRFMVREVFTPEISLRYGQEDDYPQNADPEFAKIGITHDLGMRYWASHWELPSLGQGYEMHQRTVDQPLVNPHDPSETLGEAVRLPHGRTVYRVLSFDNLQTLMRAKDVMPYWREPLETIAFRQLTRVDVRRMHKLGLLDYDAVVKAYLDTGYDLTNATHLADFTVANNAGVHHEEIEPFRAPLRGKVIAEFIDGLLDENECKEALKGVLYDDAQIAAFIGQAQWERTANSRRAIANGVRKLYTATRMEANEAEERLKEHGFTEEEANRLLSDWQFDRHYTELTNEQHANKELTKGEILALYEDNLATRDDVAPMLRSLGYDDAEVTHLLALADFKQTRLELKLRQDHIHELYSHHRVDREAAQEMINSLGLSAGTRETLLSKWDLELETRVSKLPLSYIEQLAIHSIIDANSLHSRLEAEGYQEQDIDWLFQLWGYKEQLETAKESSKVTKAQEAAAEKQRQTEERAQARIELQRRLASQKDILLSFRRGLFDHAAAVEQLVAVGLERDVAEREVHAAEVGPKLR